MHFWCEQPVCCSQDNCHIQLRSASASCVSPALDFMGEILTTEVCLVCRVLHCAVTTILSPAEENSLSATTLVPVKLIVIHDSARFAEVLRCVLVSRFIC